MGRHKGGGRKYWTAEEKYKTIKPILDFEKSSMQVTRETGLSNGMICNWIKTYNEKGFDGLIAKTKHSNPMCSLMKKKNLTDIEKLELENMKLRIENEMLKKGFLMKEDGTYVKFMK